MGQYYGSPFKGLRGVMQSDLLYLTTLNMLVDVLIQHWVMLVAGYHARKEVLGGAVHNLATLFCVDDNILASPRPYRLQYYLYILVGIFNRVVLRKKL